MISLFAQQESDSKYVNPKYGHHRVYMAFQLSESLYNDNNELKL